MHATSFSEWLQFPECCQRDVGASSVASCPVPLEASCQRLFSLHDAAAAGMQGRRCRKHTCNSWRLRPRGSSWATWRGPQVVQGHGVALCRLRGVCQSFLLVSRRDVAAKEGQGRQLPEERLQLLRPRGGGRRWCKGGMQICFNRRKCPLLRKELPIFQRILWTTGYWVGLTHPTPPHPSLSHTYQQLVVSHPKLCCANGSIPAPASCCLHTLQV